MDPRKKARLEAAGFRFGDAADFLGEADCDYKVIGLLPHHPKVSLLDKAHLGDDHETTHLIVLSIPTGEQHMNKEEELLAFLHEHVFDPILTSPVASNSLKTGVRLTITRLQQRDAAGMLQYYWSAVIGTEKSTAFARQMREEGFTRFEEIIEDFRDRFNDRWLRS